MLESKFGFNDLATLVTYYGKNKRITPLISTLPQHNRVEVNQSQDNKPSIILKYNQTKGGVDEVDRLKVNYSIAGREFSPEI